MLIGPRAVESNLIFQLELKLQQPCLGQTRLLLGVESRWCCEASEPGRYWTGYQIIDLSLSSAEIIETLIKDWTVETEQP